MSPLPLAATGLLYCIQYFTLFTIFTKDVKDVLTLLHTNDIIEM